LKTITASNFRARFTDLLRDLATGPVEITKHGKVIAVLSSPDSPVEALEEVETATDSAKAPEPVTSPSEAEETLRDIAAWTQENNVVVKDAETQARINSFDENEEEEEEGEDWSIYDDKAFEDYLSGQEPDSSALKSNWSC
jgi:prevent-host-death family protein